MKIAIISDVHDQVENLKWAMDELKSKNISHIFALGDYSSAYTVERMQIENSNVPVHAVWGNCDGDKQPMLSAASTINTNLSFSKYEFSVIELENKKYFITHYPILAENAASTLDYVAVFHGHTHIMRDEKIGTTPIICPGKLALYPHDKISIAIFDTDTLTTEFLIK